MQSMNPELVKLYENIYTHLRFEREIPEWYPRDSRGHAITHVYHIVDNRSGTDMETLGCIGDFTTDALMKVSFFHIDEKCRNVAHFSEAQGASCRSG